MNPKVIGKQSSRESLHSQSSAKLRRSTATNSRHQNVRERSGGSRGNSASKAVKKCDEGDDVGNDEVAVSIA